MEMIPQLGFSLLILFSSQYPLMLDMLQDLAGGDL